MGNGDTAAATATVYVVFFPFVSTPRIFVFSIGSSQGTDVHDLWKMILFCGVLFFLVAVDAFSTGSFGSGTRSRTEPSIERFHRVCAGFRCEGSGLSM